MTNYTYYPLLAFKPYMLQNTQIETHSSIFEKKNEQTKTDLFAHLSDDHNHQAFCLNRSRLWSRL